MKHCPSAYLLHTLCRLWQSLSIVSKLLFIDKRIKTISKKRKNWIHIVWDFIDLWLDCAQVRDVSLDKELPVR